MMNARTSLFTSLAIAAGLGLAGCGGSSNNNEDDTGGTVTSYTVTLPAGHGLTKGTEDYASGETKLGDGTTVTCPSEGGCTVTVAEGDTSGILTATSTGGMVVVTAPAAMVELVLPEENNVRDRLDQDDEEQTPGFLDEKAIKIPAGSSENYGGVRFSCPAGGSDCKVYFNTGLNDKNVTATTGGEGNGTATAALVSQVGTGVGLRTLRDAINESPANATAGSPLADKLGFPHENDSDPFVSRHLKAPALDAAEAGSNAAAAASGLDGWNGAAWQKDRETLVRFDNQADLPTFAEKYGENADDTNNVTPVATDEPDFWDLVMTEEPLFPGRPGLIEVDPNETDDDYIYRIAATFDGVPGFLTCPRTGPGSDCANLTAEGNKLNSTDGVEARWVFTASNSEDKVDGAGTRDDYLAFGWWRQDKASGGGFEDFEPLYGGRIPFPVVTDDAVFVNGKATYKGGAAGNYTDYSGRTAPSGVDRTFTDDSPDRNGGWFVADAELTANFGDAGTPGDTASATRDDNRISGSISNFRGANGSLGDWEVMLDRAVLVAREADIMTANPTSSGKADGEGWTGNWGADFYGTHRDNNIAADAPGSADRLPSGIAGWFHASTTSDTVSVQGSFGAERQP